MDWACTFKDVRQPARYFFTSTSLPNRNFSDKCVRCLKEFVSTTLRCDTPQSCSDIVNVNKNLINMKHELYSVQLISNYIILNTYEITSA